MENAHDYSHCHPPLHVRNVARALVLPVGVEVLRRAENVDSKEKN